jgi:ATP-binding cassette subfamily B protein
MLLASFALSQLAALPDALAAVWLKLLGEALLRGDRRLLVVMSLALGLTATATWFLLTVSTRVQRRFRDKVTIALEAHVARLQAGIATIAHQERPEYLDRLSVLATRCFVLDHMYMSLVLDLRLDPAPGRGDRAPHVDPSGLALLAAFALPTCSRRPGVPASTRGRRARRSASRLARTSSRRRPTAAAGQGGARPSHRRAPRPGAAARPGSAGTGPVAAARGTSAAWHALAWADLRRAYVGAIVFVLVDAEGPAAETCCSCSRPARACPRTSAPPSARSASCAGSGSDGSRRLAWLEDYAASVVATRTSPRPSACARASA